MSFQQEECRIGKMSHWIKDQILKVVMLKINNRNDSKMQREDHSA